MRGKKREEKSSQIDVSCYTDDRSRVVMGRLKWKDEEHLHVNAQLVPRISDHEAYDVLLKVATPFELVKNVSFNTGYGNSFKNNFLQFSLIYFLFTNVYMYLTGINMNLYHSSI